MVDTTQNTNYLSTKLILNVKETNGRDGGT